MLRVALTPVRVGGGERPICSLTPKDKGPGRSTVLWKRAGTLPALPRVGGCPRLPFPPPALRLLRPGRTSSHRIFAYAEADPPAAGDGSDDG